MPDQRYKGIIHQAFYKHEEKFKLQHKPCHVNKMTIRSLAVRWQEIQYNHDINDSVDMSIGRPDILVGFESMSTDINDF